MLFPYVHIFWELFFSDRTSVEKNYMCQVHF